MEEAKRVARQTQRVLEKEWKVLKDQQKLPSIVKKIETLKEQEGEYLGLAKRRHDYLERILVEERMDEYMRVKYYRLLVDYLARKGEFDLAEQLSKAFNIQVLQKFHVRIWWTLGCLKSIIALKLPWISGARQRPCNGAVRIGAT